MCSRYLSALGHHLKWTLKDYWNFLKDYFCVIDADSLDLIWNKYDDSIFEKDTTGHMQLNHQDV